MKLEEGMYVRYIRSFKNNDKPIIEIDKITKINNYAVHLETWENNAVYSLESFKDLIKGKPSYNIIDLIEEEDLLKIEYYSLRYKERVERLFEVTYKNKEHINLVDGMYEFILVNGEFNKLDKQLKPVIKSIVTKEQFKSMEYEVEK